MRVSLARGWTARASKAFAILCVLSAGGLSLPAHAAEAAKPPSMAINVGQISDSVAFFPIFVAKKQGFFAQHGLQVGDIPLLGTGAKLAAALQSGSIDVAGGNGTDPLNLYRANKGTRMIAQLVNTYYVDIIVGPSFVGAAPTAPLSDKIRALKGKKIGVTGPGSGTQALVDYLLGLQGMKSSTDATLVSLGSNMTGALGALKTKRVDALSFPQPVGEQAEATHIGEIYISPTRGDVPQISHMVHGVVFTTQSVLDEKGPRYGLSFRASRMPKVISTKPTSRPSGRCSRTIDRRWTMPPSTGCSRYCAQRFHRNRASARRSSMPKFSST
ncbi:hypothetical protein CDEF62S_04429 [Castellaniella defragrans]